MKSMNELVAANNENRRAASHGWKDQPVDACVDMLHHSPRVSTKASGMGFRAFGPSGPAAPWTEQSLDTSNCITAFRSSSSSQSIRHVSSDCMISDILPDIQ